MEEMEDGIMTVRERLLWLTGVIRSDTASTADKLRASEQMNRIQEKYDGKGQSRVEKLEELL